MPLTAEVAQRMIRASQDKARELGVAVSTAIVDADGRLFAFGRMEGAHWVSVEVSQAKASTGAVLQNAGTPGQRCIRRVAGAGHRPAFPRRRGDVPRCFVTHLATQLRKAMTSAAMS